MVKIVLCRLCNTWTSHSACSQNGGAKTTLCSWLWTPSPKAVLMYIHLSACLCCQFQLDECTCPAGRLVHGGEKGSSFQWFHTPSIPFRGIQSVEKKWVPKCPKTGWHNRHKYHPQKIISKKPCPAWWPLRSPTWPFPEGCEGAQCQATAQALDRCIGVALGPGLGKRGRSERLTYTYNQKYEIQEV